jgi:sortase A
MRKNAKPSFDRNEPNKNVTDSSATIRKVSFLRASGESDFVASGGSDSGTSGESGSVFSSPDEISEPQETTESGRSSRYPTFQFIAAEKSKAQRSTPDLLKEGRQKSEISKMQRRLKRLGVASIPFVIFLAGLIILSIGLFSYIENESILAVFITSRDSSRVNGLNEEQNVTEISPPTTQTTVKESATLPSETEGVLVVPFYYQGDQIGTIKIDSIEMELGVYQGDTEDQFQLGAGHSNMSFLPGQEGNIVLAAHRTNYFRDLEYVKVGDLIEFETTYGLFEYKIRQIDILEKPDFGTIIEDTDEEQLTLYTCYPFIYVGNAPNRYVIRCDLQKSELYT